MTTSGSIHEATHHDLFSSDISFYLIKKRKKNEMCHCTIATEWITIEDLIDKNLVETTEKLFFSSSVNAMWRVKIDFWSYCLHVTKRSRLVRVMQQWNLNKIYKVKVKKRQLSHKRMIFDLADIYCQNCHNPSTICAKNFLFQGILNELISL